MTLLVSEQNAGVGGVDGVEWIPLSLLRLLDNNHLVVWFSPTEMELSLLFVVKMQIHSENLGSAAFVGFRSTSSIHLPFGWRSDPK